MLDTIFSPIVESVTANWIALGAALVSLAGAVSAGSHRRREMRIGWNRELMAWAKSAMEALCEAQTFAGDFGVMPPEMAHTKATEIRAKLAASVDHGRLFFENIEGKRPHLLDPLVGVVRLMREHNKYDAKTLVNAIDTHRFNFWHRVQKVVDPRWMRRTVQGADATAGAGANDYATPERDGALRP